MAFIEMDFASGGSGSLKTYATLNLKTTEEELKGKAITITLDEDNTYFVSTTFGTTLDGGIYKASAKLQSIGNYTIECESATENIEFTEFNTKDKEISLYVPLVKTIMTGEYTGKAHCWAEGARTDIPIWYGFDNVTSDNIKRVSAAAESGQIKLYYDFGNVGLLENVSVFARGWSSYTTTGTIKLYTSKDNVTYDDIGSLSYSGTASSLSKLTKSIDTKVACRYLRIDFGNGVQINEVNMNE